MFLIVILMPATYNKRQMKKILLLLLALFMTPSVGWACDEGFCPMAHHATVQKASPCPNHSAASDETQKTHCDGNMSLSDCLGLSFATADLSVQFISLGWHPTGSDTPTFVLPPHPFEATTLAMGQAPPTGIDNAARHLHPTSVFLRTHRLRL